MNKTRSMTLATLVIVPLLLTAAQASEVKMQYFENAQSQQIAQFAPDTKNAFFEDILSSDDPKAPIACALFRMEKGEPLDYTYTYDEAKIILEGEMTISDGHSTVHTHPGDVVYLPKGASMTFSSDSYGLAFTCGQRESGSA